jgi:hypothetical protein
MSLVEYSGGLAKPDSSWQPGTGVTTDRIMHRAVESDRASGDLIRVYFVNSAPQAPARITEINPSPAYVRLSSVMTGAAKTVLFISLFSLLLSALSGYAMIDPLIAILLSIGSVAFWIMGKLVANRNRSDASRADRSR